MSANSAVVWRNGGQGRGGITVARTRRVSYYASDMGRDATLPFFPYHPDPVGSGSIAPAKATCLCCGEARGWGYTLQPYGPDLLEEDQTICPWCISSGRAAEELDCTFVQDVEHRLPPGPQNELLKRTPGYLSWQGEWWLCHCNDGCEFRGEVTAARLAALPVEVIERSAVENNYINFWRGSEQNYRHGAGVAIYEFVCRHCGQVRLGADAS